MRELKPGDRIGHYEVVAEIPGNPDVARFRAVDIRGGEPVEVLALRPPLGRDASAQADFADVHRRLLRTQDPGVNPTTALLEEKGSFYAIRGPLEDLHLDQIVGPLPPGTVAAIGALLLPAILAAGPATRSALTGKDIGLSNDGFPRLAPLGRPSSRIDRNATRYAAPEAFQGAPADGPAGLYGLGALLYRLATGREPIGGSQAPPASAVQRGIPATLDQALARLLSADPAQRPGALPLLQQAAGELHDLRQLPVSPVHTPIAYTRTAAPLDRANSMSGTPLFIPAVQLAQLDPPSRSAAAGFSNLPESELEKLVEAGLPLVMAVSERKPKEELEKLQQSLGIPLESAGGLGCLPAVLIAAAVGLVPVAIVTAFFAFPVAVASLLTAVGFIAGAVGVSLTRRNRVQKAHRAWRLQQTAQLRSQAIPAFAQLLKRCAELRRRLAETELPLHMHADLRSAVREIESAGAALADRIHAADAALTRLDPPQLRVRLVHATAQAAKDPKAALERDQLARALTDLDEVVEKRQRAIADLERLQGSLDEIATTLAHTPALTANIDLGILESATLRTQAAQRALSEPDQK